MASWMCWVRISGRLTLILPNAAAIISAFDGLKLYDFEVFTADGKMLASYSLKTHATTNFSFSITCHTPYGSMILIWPLAAGVNVRPGAETDQLANPSAAPVLLQRAVKKLPDWVMAIEDDAVLPPTAV